MTAAEEIAEFAQQVARNGVPEPVATAAKWHLLDAIGVGLAAGAGDAGRWAEAAAPGGALLLTGALAEAGAAAMINGSLIHALEYDATHIESIVHGSAVAAPLAICGVPERRSGQAALRTFVTIWETSIALGLSAPGGFQARGIQATSAAGAVGAAAAVAAEWGLSSAQIVSAVGIATGQASGTLGFLSEGATCKALNPGWAARTGLDAARLAAAGMEGPASGIEGRYGLLHVCAGRTPEGADGPVLASLGARWSLPDVAFKLWPCCHYVHPFLEAAQAIRAKGIAAEEIDHVVLEGPPQVAPLIAEPWARRQSPARGYDAKWALPYCVALMLRTGAVDVEAFEGPPRDDVQALAARMSWRDQTDHEFPARFSARLEVRTATGPHFSECRQVRGAPDRPIRQEEVVRKFERNAGRRLSEARLLSLKDAVLSLDAARDLSALRFALAQ